MGQITNETIAMIRRAVEAGQFPSLTLWEYTQLAWIAERWITCNDEGPAAQQASGEREAELCKARDQATSLLRHYGGHPETTDKLRVLITAFDREIDSARAALSTPAQQDAVDAALAYLDELKDDAIAHIWPDDLKRCMESECVVGVCSVRMGSPDGTTVPLFSREQVARAIEQSVIARGVGRGEL